MKSSCNISQIVPSSPLLSSLFGVTSSPLSGSSIRRKLIHAFHEQGHIIRGERKIQQNLPLAVKDKFGQYKDSAVSRMEH
ncbi:hypothetical protein V6Z12_D08G047000 [Gossypium hirsutum]